MNEILLKLYEYAQQNNYEEIKKYSKTHPTLIDEIACDYARLNNHNEVQVYQYKFGASLLKISLGYALGNNYEKVEEYRKIHRIAISKVQDAYQSLLGYEKAEEFKGNYNVYMNELCENDSDYVIKKKYSFLKNPGKEDEHELIKLKEKSSHNNKPEVIVIEHEEPNKEKNLLSNESEKILIEKPRSNELHNDIHTKYTIGTPYPNLSQCLYPSSSEKKELEFFSCTSLNELSPNNSKNDTSLSLIAENYDVHEEPFVLLKRHIVENNMDAHNEILFKLYEYTQDNNYEEIKEYSKTHPILIDEIACYYARANNHNEVQVYRDKLGASLFKISLGYALGNNYEKVEEYQKIHRIGISKVQDAYQRLLGYKKAKKFKEQYDVYISQLCKYNLDIVSGYIVRNDHDQIKTYREIGSISSSDIALCYARENNHDKVKEYRDRYSASLNKITLGYALGNNYEKVEEYRKIHRITISKVQSACQRLFGYEKAAEFKEKYDTYINEIREYDLDYEIVEVDESSLNYKVQTEPETDVDKYIEKYSLLKNPGKVDEHEPIKLKEKSSHNNKPEVIVIEDEETDKEKNSLSNESEKVFIEEPGSNEIHGGIHTKYTTGIPHPNLPQCLYPSSLEKKERALFSFTPLNKLSSNKSKFSLYQHDIDMSLFQASLLSLSDTLDHSVNWTFVCAGRKGNALIPMPEKGRCVLVCSEEEQEEMELYLAEHIDVLVVFKISSASHGDYQELNTVTARRIAIFLFAYFVKLKVFAMLDDNIEQLKWDKNACSGTSWEELFNFLESEVSDKGCISIPTLGGRKKTNGELGSKYFMVNMALIRELLKEEEHLFLLFPEAKQAKKWGEDYYFQIALHYLLAHKKIPGYEILLVDTIGLVRSRHNKNSFLNTTGKKANPFDEMSSLESCSLEFAHVINNTIKKLNQIIAENYKAHKEKIKFLEQVDLLERHAFANNIGTDNRLFLIENSSDFKQKFYDSIEEYDFTGSILRPYQVDAIKSVLQLKKSPARFIMAPASGKTMIQTILALFAYHAAMPGQKIFIVTPQIMLVKQFYKDLIQFISTLKNNSLSVSSDSILQVSSDWQSVSIGALKMNKLLLKQKAIIICCEDSFKKIMDEGFLIKSAPIIFLDEYHDYQKTADALCNTLVSNETIVIASSATPPNNDMIKETLYTYSIKEALAGEFHAGFIPMHFDTKYSKDNVKHFIQLLPQILKTQYHPGFGEKPCTLAQTKGIIYLESIDFCDQVNKMLHDNGIKSYSIHSSNSESNQQSTNFVNHDKAGVLLAVKKLRFGFDCPDLSWVIIARKVSTLSPQQDVEQMLGRVIRLHQDKIGLIITFKDIYNKYLLPIFEKQNKTLRLSSDFLAQDVEYFVDMKDNKQCVVKDSYVEENLSFFSQRKRKNEDVLEEKNKKKRFI